MTSSMQVGLRALPADAEGLLVQLGDMPLVDAEVIDTLLVAYADRRPVAAVPTFEGRWGHPVLFDRVLFGELLALAPDRNPRAVLESRRAKVAMVPVSSNGILIDIDTDTSYLAATAAQSPGR